MSQSLRASLGELAYKNYFKNDRVCHAPEADAVLAVIQSRLAVGNSALKDIKITIVDNPMVNAMALPDNQVVVTSGILAQAESSEEIAGVLAHEFGHKLHDHVIRSILRRGLVEIVFSALGSVVNAYPRLAYSFIGDAYSRQFESEADQTGIDLLGSAKISPKGFEDFFNRGSQIKDMPQFIKYLSTHPLSAERASVIAKANVPDALPLLSYEQWHALQTVCREKAKPQSRSQ